MPGLGQRAPDATGVEDHFLPRQGGIKLRRPTREQRPRRGDDALAGLLGGQSRDDLARLLQQSVPCPRELRRVRRGPVKGEAADLVG